MEQFVDLNQSRIFSQLGLTSGYYQIKIKENDQHKTEFSIMGRKYEFLRMSFGLKNASFILKER